MQIISIVLLRIIIKFVSKYFVVLISAFANFISREQFGLEFLVLALLWYKGLWSEDISAFGYAFTYFVQNTCNKVIK